MIYKLIVKHIKKPVVMKRNLKTALKATMLLLSCPQSLWRKFYPDIEKKSRKSHSFS